ncbi:hypothetical protein NXY55_26100, partial [Aeromonas veronii]|nr:hypothetical protein [Aeromonas veronii]
MKKILTLFLTALLLVALVACGSSASGGEENGSEKKVTFTLATPDPDEASVTLAAKEFAKVVSEKSNGSIEIKVHANGTLYGGDPSA